ncbi:MAG: peptidase [Bacteroidota bacterium]|jgi:predicted metalloprotease with PDZ domain|nr:peptidase [Bacteroidota bacterium]
MIHYKLYLKNPQSHYIYVDLTIDELNDTIVELKLPSWRPGRYELGNFSKNIKKLEVFDENENTLGYLKTDKDSWRIETNGSKKIKVTYSYHTSEINAGNCFADENQLYVNPVHLCMYIPNRMNEEHVLELAVPDNYKIASSLNRSGTRLSAENFDELADSPVIASAGLKSEFYVASGVKFWLHFMGECKPDITKFKDDFSRFTQTQLSFWGDIPVKEYHFLFQVLPYKYYHGVEHLKSTVIAIGPGYALNKGKTYEDVLGVSCHELFHTWNIKCIRPMEMLPYDFSKENYARTGFVYEGFTTYYGDLLLLTSGVFTVNQYFETLEERLTKHFHNYGRFNLSVAHSSFDTWLDGYVPGAPYRKTSIYDEGNLVAFMLDVQIMKHTNNTKGLKNVCRELYEQFGKKKIGYTERDIVQLCEKAAGVSLSFFFDKYVYGTEDFSTPLQECFSYLGIEMVQSPSVQVSESVYGFKTVDHGNNRKVSLIAPYSSAWKSGLSIGDEVYSVNGYTLKNDFNEWMNYFKHEEIELTVSSNQQLKQIKLIKASQQTSCFDTFKLKQTNEVSTAFSAWLELNA